MKIHTIARDAKQMQMAELEAINRRAAEVQATPTDNGTVEQPEQAAEEAKEAKEEATDAKATRPKKKKAGVRPN